MDLNNHLISEILLVNRESREALNRHKAFTIWLTGLSGSGKTTIANQLDLHLYNKSIRTFVLDGDNTRQYLNYDLDFSREGRRENIRRVAEVARLFNEAGVIVITALISPFQEDRENAKNIIGSEYYNEIYINSDLESCIKRDTKGLYKKALEGNLKNFTGIDSPYEVPLNPSLIIDTNINSITKSIDTIINWMSQKKLL